MRCSFLESVCIVTKERKLCAPNSRKKQTNVEERGGNNVRICYEEKKGKFSFGKKKPQHVPPHLHNAIELVYVTRGELELGVGLNLYHMEKGDFAVVFPNLIHHYQVFSEKDNEAYYFYAALELSGPFMEVLQTKAPENPVIPHENLHYEVRNALNCLIQDKEVSEVVGQAYLQIILYRCSESFRYVKKESVGSHDLVYEIMVYMLSHFQENLTLGRVAEALGINKYAVSKIFSTTFHTNFNQYLNGVRLDYATALLENTDMRVTDVYLKAGFESQRTFNRAFQQQYHQTPSEYRKNSLKNIPHFFFTPDNPKEYTDKDKS